MRSIDGEIEAAAERFVSEHVRACPQCAAKREDLLWALRRLDDIEAFPFNIEAFPFNNDEI